MLTTPTHKTYLARWIFCVVAYSVSFTFDIKGNTWSLKMNTSVLVVLVAFLAVAQSKSVSDNDLGKFFIFNVRFCIVTLNWLVHLWGPPSVTETFISKGTSKMNSSSSQTQMKINLKWIRIWLDFVYKMAILFAREKLDCYIINYLLLHFTSKIGIVFLLIFFSVECVKNSVHRGGSTWASNPLSAGTPQGRYTPWAGTPSWAGTPPGQVQPPGKVHPLDRYPLPLVMNGQYASYCNAFLFFIIFSRKTFRTSDGKEMGFPSRSVTLFLDYIFHLFLAIHVIYLFIYLFCTQNKTCLGFIFLTKNK